MKIFRGLFLRISDSGGRDLDILVVSGNIKIFRGLFFRFLILVVRELSTLSRVRKHVGFSRIISADARFWR